MIILTILKYYKMALSFEQKPVDTTDKVPVITNWTPIIGYMLKQSSIAGYFYYKLILEIRLGSVTDTIIGKLKQRRNGYSPDIIGNAARAYFDVTDIVNSQLVYTIFDQNQTGAPFGSIHTLGANTGTGATADKLLSVSGNNRTDKHQVAKITVKGYEQFATNANQVPGENSSGAINDTQYYMKASLDLFEPRDTNTDFLQGTAFQSFSPTSATSNFLTDIEPNNAGERINKVTTTSCYHTLAFLNDNANFDSVCTHLRVTYRDSQDNALSTTIFTNSSGAGGENPNNVTDAVSDNPKRLLFFGCGTANFLNSTISNLRPTAAANSGWAYYTVQGQNGGSGSTFVTNQIKFVRDDCQRKGYVIRRLGWINSKGGYDYLNFYCKNTRKIDVIRNTFEKPLGYYSSSKFFYNDTQRGKSVRSVEAKMTETLNTDFLSEQDANMLKNLILSPEVFIIQNQETEYTEAVNVIDTSYTIKTVANDRLIQYTIQIEYANNINTNS